MNNEGGSGNWPQYVIGSSASTSTIYLTPATTNMGCAGVAYVPPKREETALEWLDRRVNEIRVRL